MEAACLSLNLAQFTVGPRNLRDVSKEIEFLWFPQNVSFTVLSYKLITFC